LLLIKPRSGGWISIEFIYSESNTYNWYFDTEKEMYEAYAKVKKSLPAGVNIDDHITL